MLECKFAGESMFAVQLLKRCLLLHTELVLGLRTIVAMEMCHDIVLVSLSTLTTSER